MKPRQRLTTNYMIRANFESRKLRSSDLEGWQVGVERYDPARSAIPSVAA